MLGKKNEYDFVITEIGGTVGDIESTPFLEAIRQLKWELKKNAICVHLTYVPYLKAAQELKTKPTQHSVKVLQSVGIQPDILVLRAYCCKQRSGNHDGARYRSGEDDERPRKFCARALASLLVLLHSADGV